jgi:hypothetical protein
MLPSPDSAASYPRLPTHLTRYYLSFSLYIARKIKYTQYFALLLFNPRTLLFAQNFGFRKLDKNGIFGLF